MGRNTAGIKSVNFLKTQNSNFNNIIDSVHTLNDPHVELADTAAISLTEATHGYKTIIVPDVGQDTTLTLPAPQVDLWFHILYFGALATDGHDVLIKTATQNTDFFHGGVLHHDTNQTGQTTAFVYGDGDSNDVFNLQLGQAMDVWIRGKSATSWYIWGWTAGDTPVTIGDS